jgi:thiamine kinase-like enzyme
MTERRIGIENEAAVQSMLDTWPDWGLQLTGRPRLAGKVQGGRTNRNYRLEAPGLRDDLLLRVNHPDPQRLGIDREREEAILAVTAQAGISRPVWYWDPNQRFVIFPYLPGRAWTDKDFEDEDQRARVWPLLERLHAIETAWPRRRYHDYVLGYWRALERAGRVDAALRSAWQAFEPELRAFDTASWSARLVHHDLIPDNILETDERLYFIDWEYAAPGYPGIDVWTIEPDAIEEPFVAELMGWINGLWERLR